MEDDRYNGWTNYPTWNVALWIGNDEGLYNHVNELVEAVSESDAVVSGQRDLEPAVADAIKSFVRDDLAGDVLDAGGFVADLLGYALDSVNWYEIASGQVEVLKDRDIR